MKTNTDTPNMHIHTGQKEWHVSNVCTHAHTHTHTHAHTHTHTHARTHTHTQNGVCNYRRKYSMTHYLYVLAENSQHVGNSPNVRLLILYIYTLSSNMPLFGQHFVHVTSETLRQSTSRITNTKTTHIIAHTVKSGSYL